MDQVVKNRTFLILWQDESIDFFAVFSVEKIIAGITTM